jgi:signal transduction histidine kinase
VRNEDPVRQIRRLERCVNDLVSLLALPAVWSGSEPSHIVQILLEALLRMLDLAFIYARFKDPAGNVPQEFLRLPVSYQGTVRPRIIRELLGKHIGGSSDKSLLPFHARMGKKVMSIVPVPLGLQGEIGTIIVGSYRADFPGQTESLLLTVAANQASIGLQGARLLSEQKRIANELDQRVAERTAELAASNQELRKEIAERNRREEKLRLNEEALREAHARIARSETFLAEGQRLSLTGSFSWKVATNEITWSEQLYRIYELESGVPLTLEMIRTRVHPDDVALIDKMRMMDQERTGGDFEWRWRLLMPDHSVKYLHAVARATRDRDGQLEYIAAVQDVTARHISEEALAKARSELANVARMTSLGVLTASIAHEVNQPLSGIITNASTCLRMLSADPPNVEGARETAHRTIRDGNRASDVITRLRTLYSKKDLSPEWLNLNDAVREVISISLSELQRNRIVLRQELADDLPAIAGDRIQLQQVILNLVRNASDAMRTINNRPRELLLLTKRDENDGVCLSVTDVGVGFIDQAPDKLFEAFYTTKNEGMGIGLSVSRSIIEAHHGRLWAKPNNGPGATFTFAIPRRPQQAMGAETDIQPTIKAAKAA